MSVKTEFSPNLVQQNKLAVSSDSSKVLSPLESRTMQVGQRTIKAPLAPESALKLREIAIHNARINAVYLVILCLIGLFALGYVGFIAAPLLAATLSLNNPVASYVLVAFASALITWLASKAILPAISRLWNQEAPESISLAPKGLVNGGKNNCWANAMLQMIMHVPSLKDSVALLNPEINSVIEAIEADKKSSDSVSLANTNLVRTALKFPEQAHVDPNEAFNKLFAGDTIKNIVQLKRDQGQSTDPFCHVIEERNGRVLHDYHELLHLITVKEGDSRQPFQEVIRRSFSTDRSTQQLAEAPSSFFASFNRFAFVGREAEKITEEVRIPLKGFEFPSDCLKTKEEAHYICDAFILHQEQKSHHVAYVKKGDQWYLCDDSRVTAVTDLEAAVAMRKAYICHFKKEQLIAI